MLFPVVYPTIVGVGMAPAGPPGEVSPGSADHAPLVIEPPLNGVRELPREPAEPLVLAVPRQDVLVVAGLPGAGKTTLLRAVADSQDVVLDPQLFVDVVRERLPRVPYPLFRPAVHTLHRTRVMLALLRGTESLIIHEPGGRPRWRRRLVAAARRRGHAVHLLVVHADPVEAQVGRIRRRRTLPARRARRYEREWAGLFDEIGKGWAGSQLASEGFAGCTLLPRSAIPAVTGVRALPVTRTEGPAPHPA